MNKIFFYLFIDAYVFFGKKVKKTIGIDFISENFNFDIFCNFFVFTKLYF